MNGHGSRLLHSRRNRNHRDPRRAPTQSCDREQELTARCSLKRRTAQAAVNKMKLMEASLSEEDGEEENPRRSSRRPPVIQSSSESEGPSAHGTKPRTASFNIITVNVLQFEDGSFRKARLSLFSFSKNEEIHGRGRGAFQRQRGLLASK